MTQASSVGRPRSLGGAPFGPSLGFASRASLTRPPCTGTERHKFAVSGDLGRSAARPSGLRSASPRAPRSLALLQLLEMFQIETVELLADLEKEHAEDQHGDQYVERDAELDHHRHAVSGAR